MIIHLFSGQPGRATELQTFRLIDGFRKKSFYRRDGIHFFFFKTRNIFLIVETYSSLGMIMIFQNYWKSENMTRTTQKICRYLPPCLTNLFSIFISVIKPREVLFTYKTHGAQAAAISKEFMFSGMGKRMSDQTIRDTVSNYLFKYLNVQINFSAYRYSFVNTIFLFSKKILLLVIMLSESFEYIY